MAYNHPKYETVIGYLKKHINITAFGDVIESISGGATPLRSNEEQYTDSGIKFLRIQNITPTGFDFSDVKYITETVHNNLLKRSQLAENDLLMTITGRIGTSAVMKTSFLPANINQHIVRIRLKKGINPNFAATYLNSNIGLLLSNRSVTGTTRLALDYESIKQIPFPVISPEKQIVLSCEESISNRQYTETLRRADELLKGKDDYLFDRLNLTFNNSMSILCYAQKYSMISSRLDADFYSPNFTHFRKQIKGSPYPSVQLSEICKSISSGFAAGKQDQADDLNDDERVPQLRPFSITPYGQISFATKKYVPISRLQEKDYCKKGEVLFNNTNSAEWVGKSTVFDIDTPCAASNHITRITLKAGINPYYIAAFFNMLRNIGYWKLLSTYFNNQAGVNTETLKTVRILLPEKSIQDEIAEEILRRKNTAEALRIGAERDWVAAKAEFERKLLGE